MRGAALSDRGAMLGGGFGISQCAPLSAGPLRNSSVARVAYLPGSANADNFTTPDSIANSITGDIEFRFYFSQRLVSNQILAYKGNGAADNAYWVMLGTTNLVNFFFTQDGTTTITVVSSAALPYPLGTFFFLKITYNSATGKVNFSTCLDDVNYLALGIEKTTVTGAIFDSTQVLKIGVDLSGHALSGSIARAKIFNGIGGPLAVDFDPGSWTSGPNWRSATGELWTINGKASIQLASVGRHWPTRRWLAA